jgi:hypothetical protein
MAVNRSSFRKDLATIPTLTVDNYLSLSDGTSNPVTNIRIYKATLGDVASFIGEKGLIAPVVIPDQSVFASAAGTISITGSAGVLSSSIDYSAIEVGDIITAGAGGGFVSTIVQAKAAFPNITVLPLPIPTGATYFFYGTPTLATEDTVGNKINTLSYGGITTAGTLLVDKETSLAAASFFNAFGALIDGVVYVTDAVRCSTFTSYPGVGYCDIRSSDDTYIVQRNVDDGMVTYYHRPFLNATLAADQVLTTAAWNPVAFAVVNGTDAQNTTKYRNVVGAPVYDTTNYAYPVPYSTDYPSAAYMVNAQVLVEVKAGVNDYFYLSVYSGSTATGDQLILAEFFYRFSFAVTNKLFVFNVTRMVYLNPNVNIYHRWIRVKCYMNNGTNNGTIIQTDENTYFNIVCLG